MKISTFLGIVLILFNGGKGISQDNQTTLRVITYNIWNGFDYGRDTTRELAFQEWVTFQKPDILALQELCGFTAETLAELAKKWGHPYSLMLKEDGYPVGITSRWPIRLIRKEREGMWHGMLQVETAGIDFFVVHLSPSDWSFRHQEARLIVEALEAVDHENYMVLGDFNAHSPMDYETLKQNQALRARYQWSDARQSQYQNLRNGEWDFSVVSTFLASGLIDVTLAFTEPGERYSFPTPALAHIWQTPSEVARNRQRIDYILTSFSLSRQCVYARVLNGPETARLSDHYPVVADFIRPGK